MSGSQLYRAVHQVIDRLGCVWPGDGSALARSIGGPLTGPELVKYGVTNLGWVEITLCGERLQIKCRPLVLSDLALAELCLTMLRSDWRVIALSVLTDDWQHYIHRDRADVLTVIASVAGDGQVERLAHLPRLMLRAVEPSTSHLYGATQLALHAAQSRTLEQITPVLDEVYAGRWSLSSVDRDAGRVVLSHLGGGFTPFNPSWNAPGLKARTLDDYADAEYAAWIAEQRKRVDEMKQAQFDEVDALVRFPGLGPSRLRYARVTTPIELLDGSRFLLSAARTDSSIDLRKTG